MMACGHSPTVSLSSSLSSLKTSSSFSWTDARPPSPPALPPPRTEAREAERRRDPSIPCGSTARSIRSRRLLSWSRDSAMRSSCCFSSMDFWCVQHMILNNPAKENSRDPSSLSLLAPTALNRPNRPLADWVLICFLASSASFRSCSSSYFFSFH